MSDVIIVGGGASGMLCALLLAEKGNKVTLIEKNEKLGKKLFITGKGRCNLTNLSDAEEHLNALQSNRKFMYSSLYSFTPYDTVDLFNSLGLETKVERGNRVFPVSDHSSDVIKTLENALRRHRAEVLLNTKVSRLLISGHGQEKSGIKGVLLSDGKKLFADKVVVATGGRSYSSTGSTGDGYKFAVSAGMDVTPQSPSLVPLNSTDEDVRKLQGLSLKNVGIKLSSEKKVLYSDFGEMLFTHFGVSGPVILSASAAVKPDFFSKDLTLHIDLKNAIPEDELDKRLIHIFEENRLKEFKNSLASLFPAKLIPVMVSRSGIDPYKKCAEISREERRFFLSLIKDFKIKITGLRGFDEAVITKGGVSVKEIDPGSMESKKVSGLYFIGEVLDIDSFTGGYNLQLAWSTAAAAAAHISSSDRA
ncbi:MAG: NAD(P)/FAD-dependent oxidoreductase [Lachnospiraceae bacterium]|nr:NAD(P)/FAD-dependent oxidoreductase [Lachnospiraceae bacterium]